MCAPACAAATDPAVWVMPRRSSAERFRRTDAARVPGNSAEWAGSPEKLAVENLETYPLDFIQPVLDRIPVSRCVDVGHLWLDGHNPIPYLQAALRRTRVIHMHGIAERDHHSLRFMPHEKVSAVWNELIRLNYDGVLTLEVFSEEDFLSSIEVIERLS